MNFLPEFKIRVELIPQINLIENQRFWDERVDKILERECEFLERECMCVILLVQREEELNNVLNLDSG